MKFEDDSECRVSIGHVIPPVCKFQYQDERPKGQLFRTQRRRYDQEVAPLTPKRCLMADSQRSFSYDGSELCLLGGSGTPPLLFVVVLLNSLLGV